MKSFLRQLNEIFNQDDVKYLELTNRFIKGDKSVEKELRKMVEETAKSNGYVLVWRASRYGKPHLDPREGYQLTFSSRKEVADSYAENPDTDTKAFYILDKNAREFPVRKVSIQGKDYNEFSKTGFDNSVWGDVLVARQVFDIGPRASIERDPKMLFSYPSDIYATKSKEKNVKLVDLITNNDKNEIIPLSKRFDNNNSDIRY